MRIDSSQYMWANMDKSQQQAKLCVLIAQIVIIVNANFR